MMHLRAGTTDVLSPKEVGAIHHAALDILRRVGMTIENDDILAHLQAHGGMVDAATQRVCYAPDVVERFIAETEGLDWATAQPEVTASAGVYHGLYHDPVTGDLVEWNEARQADYFALARSLEHVGSAAMLGCRLKIPPHLEPLYERYYCWKYGAREGASIHLDALCPYLYELYQLRADQLGQTIAQAFRGTVYLIPALKLGRHEAYQFLYFWRRGLQVHIGDMYALGATAPVTLAGAVALSLAEQLALGILQRAFFGGRSFGLGCSISPFDMRTMIYPYGRPEMAYTGLAMAQMARFYGFPYHGHAGLTDAKLPSCEVGAQKALTAIPTLLAAGHMHLDVGLLSIDEVCSPIQMILDDEFVSALQYLCRDFGVEEDDLAVDLIARLGPGGNYLDTEHTYRHYRAGLWEPCLWSREMVGGWLDAGRLLDVDRARERYFDWREGRAIEPQLSEGEESDLLALIRRAGDMG